MCWKIPGADAVPNERRLYLKRPLWVLMMVYFLVFKVDRLQMIVVAKNLSVLQLFISRMPKMCAILQLVSAPLNPLNAWLKSSFVNFIPPSQDCIEIFNFGDAVVV